MRYKFMLFMIISSFFLTGLVFAQEQKSFAVLPFEIHGPKEYQYLSQGVQSMLSSRLTRSGRSTSIPAGEISRLISDSPENSEQAEEIRSDLNADFLVYGSVTIMDKETSLDVYTVAADQNLDPISRQPSLSGLIPSLEEAASVLLKQAFPDSTDSPESEPVSSQTVTASPPEEEDVFINPHFRIEDDPHAAGRWRSQSLSFTGVGIALGKTSQDDPQTIFILGERKVHAYRMSEGRMVSLAVYEAPLTYECLNINTFDINRDGNHEIIVSAVQDERARSFILSFENDEFKVVHERIPFYINTVKMPPDFKPTLVGQKPATGTRLFNPGSVQEIIMTSKGPELSRGVQLPPMTNVFNFNYLPYEDEYLVVTVENDQLNVFNSSHKRLYTTSDEYAGRSLGLEYYASMPGLGKGSDQDPDTYYIPVRLLPVRLGSDEQHYLLTQKHYAGLSKILVRQRNFAEGEIRALFWDEVGLNVHWSTKKIRATVTDFGIYDIDGDGQDELVVLVNTHPGITGMQSKDAIVLAYKMDFNSQKDSR
ncbi:MAG: hypothetical protein ACLFRQ_04300 [Desulfonatronovibrio sp.]